MRKDGLCAGQVFAYELVRGGWMACQAVKAARSTADIGIIRATWRERPSLDEVQEALSRSQHSSPFYLEVFTTFSLAPVDFVSLGVLEHPATPGQVVFRRWRDIEDEDDQTIAAASPRLALRYRRLVVGPAPSCDVIAPVGSSPWSRLADLSGIQGVEYSGHDVGVLDFLRSNPGIKDFTWRNHGQERIDVRECPLRELSLSDGPLKSLFIDRGIRNLTLTPRGASLEVSDESKGAYLQLSLKSVRDELPQALPSGLPRLRTLVLEDPHALHLSRLRVFPGLRFLYSGPSLGHTTASDRALLESDQLAHFKELQEISLAGFASISAESLPSLDDLPKLASVEVRGLRSAEAKCVKERWKKVRESQLRNVTKEAAGSTKRRSLLEVLRPLNQDAARQISGAHSVEEAASVLRSYVAEVNGVHRGRMLDTVDRRGLRQLF